MAITYDEFQNQVVIVTGAASGIGQAQARAFLQQGAQVAGIDCQEAGLRELQKIYGNHFLPLVGDVTDAAWLQLAVTEVVENLGEIAGLVNTVGILDEYLPTLATPETLWDQVMATNVKSVYQLTNLVLPAMLARKEGFIINMASIASLVAGGGGAAYTTAKHAIAGYTKQLALDYSQQGIHVNGIAPGAIKTPMNQADFAGNGAMAKWVADETPLKRWAQPEEVAALTLFLASQESSYLQGDIIPIDGGWLLK